MTTHGLAILFARLFRSFPVRKSASVFAGVILLFCAAEEACAYPEADPDPAAWKAVGCDAGEQLRVYPDGEGAAMHCGFQKMDARATPSGLWVTIDGRDGARERFSLLAVGLGRSAGSGVPLAVSGRVQVRDSVAAWRRPGLTEEYSVSIDGIRQDLVVAAPPGGVGSLRVDLDLNGAIAETASYGARITLDRSHVKLAYGLLRVLDANGRILAASFSAPNEHRLSITVDDADAVYPVRIDPTYSNANWASLGGVPGTDGVVNAVAVDKIRGVAYVGGAFKLAGTTIVTNVAKWDGSGWSALGSIGFVYTLALDGAGNLYAGGDSGPNAGVSKWNGSAWSLLGSSFNGFVKCLAVDAAGNVFAGGGFSTAGGVAANNIAKWNGGAWSALGSGANSEVMAVAVDGAGNLYAGGSFTSIGSVAANYVARWNGNAWSALSSGMNSYVSALVVDGASNLYAGGYFTTAGGVAINHVAKWNGSAWAGLSSGANGDVNALAMDSAGNLYVGGQFTFAGGVSASAVAEWNGHGWAALGSGVAEGQSNSPNVTALAVDGSGNLYAGGLFTGAGASTATTIAKWNGAAWSALGTGINARVKAATFDAGGNLYVAGDFTSAGNTPTYHVAKWDGNVWSSFGSGLDNSVEALAFDAGGNLYVGGLFTSAGGVSAKYVAKWNGSAWSALGSGMSGNVMALAFDSAGNLYAGGQFTFAGGVSANYVAKWNGSAWAALGSGAGGYVFALAADGAGNLYAGGDHVTAKWNGTAWSALGPGVNGTVYALALDGAGNLYAAGEFGSNGLGNLQNIGEWNGSVWSDLGSGLNNDTFALAVDAAGNLYAGGAFTTAGGVSAPSIAEWNGSAWSGFGGGTADYQSTNSVVRAVAFDRAGNLDAGGDFSVAGGQAAGYLTQINLAPTPHLTVQHASENVVDNFTTINFPATSVGFTTTAALTILSTGSDTLAISGVSFGGPNQGDFTVASPPASSVAPGSSTTVVVNFTPSVAGSRAAALQIASNDPNFGSFIVNLGCAAVPLATVTTLAATAVTSNGATLHATVDANGYPTAVSFDYGATASYGANIAGAPGLVNGNINTSVSASLTGLSPGSIYHFRVDGASGTGASSGADLTFTTLAIAPSSLTYPANPAIYVPGAPIAADSPSSNGGPVASYSVSPPLPAGLTLDPSTGVISGTPAVASLAANYTVTATNTGGSANAVINIAVGSPLEGWRQQYFGTAENSGNAADAADPFQTGVSNLLVFAFLGSQQNPAHATPAQLPQVQMSGGNLLFTFSQPSGVSGVTFGAECTSAVDSGAWTPVLDSGSGNVHTFSVPIGENTQMFIRLTVTNP